MRAGQKYFWPALFALERGRRGTCCIRIFEVLEGTDIPNADILDMLASTLMDDFASTSFAIVKQNNCIKNKITTVQNRKTARFSNIATTFFTLFICFL